MYNSRLYDTMCLEPNLSERHIRRLCSCLVCPFNTRRPASADMTARRQFHVGLRGDVGNWWLLGKPVFDRMFAVIKMCNKNIAGRFFGLVTKHACDRRTDRITTPKTTLA